MITVCVNGVWVLLNWSTNMLFVRFMQEICVPICSASEHYMKTNRSSINCIKTVTVWSAGCCLCLRQLSCLSRHTSVIMRSKKTKKTKKQACLVCQAALLALHSCVDWKVFIHPGINVPRHISHPCCHSCFYNPDAVAAIFLLVLWLHMNTTKYLWRQHLKTFSRCGRLQLNFSAQMFSHASCLFSLTVKLFNSSITILSVSSHSQPNLGHSVRAVFKDTHR